MTEIKVVVTGPEEAYEPVRQDDPNKPLLSARGGDVYLVRAGFTRGASRVLAPRLSARGA